jgi:hypothetical protein
MSRTALRFPEHGERYFVEEYTEQERYEFARSRPRKTMLGLLGSLDDALGRALMGFQHQPRSKGGQRPLWPREFLIVELAVLWQSLGREVSGGPNSPFAAFVVSVVRTIGWPNKGLPDAIANWRHLG